MFLCLLQLWPLYSGSFLHLWQGIKHIFWLGRTSLRCPHFSTLFFYKQHLRSMRGWTWWKISTLGLNFYYLKIIVIFHPRYYPNIIAHALKWSKKTFVCFYEIIWLIIMKLNMKMQNRSRRYDINRPKSRHGHKCSKYKNCNIMVVLICIEQHLNKIWSSIHERFKQHWGWVLKKRCK